MFIYSIRASSIKFFAVIVLTIALLIGLLVIGNVQSAAAISSQVNLTGIDTNEERVAFIKEMGITVEEVPVEDVDFALPKDFDRVISGYNEIQRLQGLDLSKYKNKRVTRYTYRVVGGCEGYEGEVHVNLIIYRNTVIACDISSADPGGFIKPLINLN